MKKKIKRTVLLGVMAALAMILSYLESLLPPLSAAFPGIKMGLPNIVIVVALYRFGIKEAAVISVVRLSLSAHLFGNTMTLMYSFAGAVLSLTLMAIIKKTGAFSTLGVSVVGGVSHNLGQIIIAILLLRTPKIMYYMIALSVSGTVAGLLVGLAGSIALKRLAKVLI